jgi:hypothetical protein
LVFNYKNGFLGIIPGSLQAVRYKKKYIKTIFIKNSRGKAGETSQFYPTTKIQKGIVIVKVQQYI